MFKRMTTSLTKPPLAVFFMKDSWGRVILYLLLIPLFLMLPTWLESTVNPGMKLDRYELLVETIQKDFILEDTKIVDGILTTNQNKTASFEYFQLTIGNQEASSDKIQIVFLEEDLAIYMTDIEILRKDYDDLGLSQFDFSIVGSSNARVLANAIRTFYNTTNLFTTTEVFISYFVGLFDYIFYAILMALFMLMFTRSLPIPFRFRLKLSVYLSTIFVVIDLLAALFKVPAISYLIIPVLYIWHFWAYRSIKIVDQGLTL